MDQPDDVCRLARNVASIAAIPWEALPDGVARGCLLDMAYGGLDVAACEARAAEWHVRVQRHEMTCAEWAAQFSV